MNLFAKFARHCRAAKLFGPSDAILLAVSGGVDSVVMLDLFVALARRHVQKLGVAHIDHDLRPDSVEDEEFVRALAASHGFPYFTEKIAPKAYARKHKLSLESASRVLRYAALERLRQIAGADYIATAHTRNDQAETVLFRLLHGAALSGLAGIAEKRGRVVRPLLDFSRADIVAYAQSRGLSWREDASNADLSIPRNRLRHEVLPLLASQFNADLVRALARSGKAVREAHAYLKVQAAAALLNLITEETPERIVLDSDRISGYNSIIYPYVLRQAVDRLRGNAEPPRYRDMERALKLIAAARVGARVALGAGVELLRDRDGLVVQSQQLSSFDGEVELSVPLSIPGTPWRLLVETEPWHLARSLAVVSAYSQFVDAVAVKGPLRARWPRSGDRFFPLGMTHPKKVCDFFADNKLPIRLRATTPLLECDNGIVWVCGLRIDERFKVTAATKQVLHMQLLQS